MKPFFAILLLIAAGESAAAVGPQRDANTPPRLSAIARR